MTTGHGRSSRTRTAAPVNSVRHRAARDGWFRTVQAGTRTTVPDPRLAAFTARWPAACGEFPAGLQTLTTDQWVAEVCSKR